MFKAFIQYVAPTFRSADLKVRPRYLLLTLVPVVALAQTPPTQAPIERVTLDQAVQRAIEHNPTVAQATTAIGRAEALLQQARAVTRPSVSASLTNTTLDSERGFTGGVFQPQNQSAITADLTVPIIAASRWAATSQARDQIDVAKLSAGDVRRQVAVAAAQAYLAVIVQRRQVEVNERARDAAKAHLDYASKRLASGAGSRLNELRAAQEVSADEFRLENSRLAVRRAQEALGVLLGANNPIDAGEAPAFDLPDISDESAWMAARTDIQFLSAQRRAADRIVKDSFKDFWPTASASFDPQLIAPAGLFQPSKTWRVTVTLSQPIYEGGLRHGVMRQRQVTFDLATLALTAQEIQARSEVRMAKESVDSYERALASAQLSAQQANDVLRITTSAFEAGATTNLEVIDAQRSARDAEAVVTVAEDAARRARLDLLVALGRFPR
jgi:outer membrane protein TolC